jgi:plastocyanin
VRANAGGSALAKARPQETSSMVKRLMIIGALVGAFGCGSSTPSTPSPAGSSVSIVANSSTLTTTAYNPNPINIARGSTVTWVNNDTTTHTSTSDTGLWNSGNLAPGANFTMTFQNAGSFPYHCTQHANMIGTVVVQ